MRVPVADGDPYPFTVQAVRQLGELRFDRPVTFFVGENGSGKSTLLEGIAAATHLPTVGAQHIDHDRTLRHARDLGKRLRLRWRHRTHHGFFLRAEDFFGFTKSLATQRVEFEQELARIEVEQVAAIGSQDMNEAVWLKLAARTEAALAEPEIAGVVITHGTDTMEETAFFLNLVVPSEKPVVLVGAMRPATAISADGPMNLYNAVAVAAQPAARGRGVLVVANDEIHFAREIAKTNTTQVGTFASGHRGLAGLVNAGRLHLYAPPVRRHTAQSDFALAGLTALPRVDIVYSHAGMGRELIDAAVHAGARGLVIAGVGDGNLGAVALAAATDAA